VRAHLIAYLIVSDPILPFTPKILEGIRYGLMGQLAKSAGVPMQVRPISKEEVLAADECLLSSATKEVLPVTVLDEKPVGHGAQAGKPGPVWQQLFVAYQAQKRGQCGT
jgi:D-alanine transaminase